MKHPASALTCREVNDFLADYLAGELEPDTREVFDAHLTRCPECVAYLRSYAETIRLAKVALSDPPGPLPADMPERLVRAIHAARGRRAGRR